MHYFDPVHRTVRTVLLRLLVVTNTVNIAYKYSFHVCTNYYCIYFEVPAYI